MNGESPDVRALPRWVLGTAVSGTIGIGVGAFWLSFTSLSRLAALAGVPRADAWIWPLIVDGVIVVATISVVALSPHGRGATVYPWSLLIAGAAVSVAANTAHALVAANPAVPKPLAAAVWSVPPVVLLAITHLTVVLTRRSRVSRRFEALPLTRALRVDTAENSVDGAPSSPVQGSDRHAVAARLRRAGMSNRMIAGRLGVHPSTIGRWLTARAPDADAAAPKSRS